MVGTFFRKAPRSGIPKTEKCQKFPLCGLPPFIVLKAGKLLPKSPPKADVPLAQNTRSCSNPLANILARLVNSISKAWCIWAEM